MVTAFDAVGRVVSLQTYDYFSGALIASQSASYSPDSHAVTVTVGTGSSAISNTVFSDSYYNPVLTQTYPGPGVTDFTLSSYDLAERVVASQDELGQITSFGYDGLGRVSTKQLPDGATITSSYNGEGGLASMAMPGGLTWSGTYSPANQRTGEQLTSGTSVSRQFTNIFYITGPEAGLLQTAIDIGRLVTNSFTYDDFRRTATATSSSSQSWQGLSTTYLYDSGGRITNIVQTSGINPNTSVRRGFDGYGQLTNEQSYVGGTLQSSFNQSWDAGGRRAGLQSPTASFDYGYQADGLMTAVAAFGNYYNFSYANNGILNGRSNPWRSLAVNSFDGQGHVLQQTTTVGSGTPLVENLTWRPNSTLNSYAATRSGSGSWNDSRNFQYNSRGQLTSEPVGITSTTSATNNYSFDPGLLGVLVGAQGTGGLTNTWQGTLNAFSQVQTESWSEASVTLRANGSAVGASSMSASLDGNGVSTFLANGRWYSDLMLSPGSHSLVAAGSFSGGMTAAPVTNTFTVLGTNNVIDTYDASGNVTNRVFSSGKTQTLAWDAASRLLGVTQWNNPTNGFFWTAIYDGLGRRLRTEYLPVVNGITNVSATLVLDSYFDPEVEFGEVGVAANGLKTWKVLGPDLDGHFGSMQGVGGVEATVREGDLLTTPVLNDYFGNVLATVSGTSADWNSARVGGYGPVQGYQSPTLTTSGSLADTLVWRSRGIDPSGFYNLGARYYDPLAGHFLSADPLGHLASMDLHSFCGGDPINRFDPTGRFGKGNFAQGYQALGTAYIQSREAAREFDLAHEDQIDDTAITVAQTIVFSALAEVGGAVLEEAFMGSRLGMAEGELGGMEAWGARSASWAESVETEAGIVAEDSESLAAAARVELSIGGAVEGASVEGVAPSIESRNAQTVSETTESGLNGGNILANQGARGVMYPKNALLSPNAEWGGNLAAEGGGLGEWQTVNEAMSERATAYQKQITGQSGQAYVVNGVKFDGISGNTLLDAKGLGYANFVNNGQFQPWFSGQQRLVIQAENQIQAAGGAPIQWHIAEEEALPAFQNLFQQNGITGIQLIHTPVVP